MLVGQQDRPVLQCWHAADPLFNVDLNRDGFESTSWVDCHYNVGSNCNSRLLLRQLQSRCPQEVLAERRSRGEAPPHRLSAVRQSEQDSI